MTIGVLLVNLGTPDSPSPKDVKRYLNEFLTDGRVIDLPKFKRNLLVRGVIVPKRFKESAALYASIWGKEGFPLLVYGGKTERLLQERLGGEFKVKLAMRYQNPSIAEGLMALKGCAEIVILPLFPQYASATVGSIHEKVFTILKRWEVIPKLHFISGFSDHPALLEAFAEKGKEYALEDYDHILFSYHGLPKRQIRKGDLTGTCLKVPDCCRKNRRCYAAQCLMTTEGIARRLSLTAKRWTQTYQSRLGKEPWLRPYTGEVLQALAKRGIKKVLVFCPAFVCDCLETLEEISSQYKNEFLSAGGESLDLVEGLNDSAPWIEALERIVRDETSRAYV